MYKKKPYLKYIKKKIGFSLSNKLSIFFIYYLFLTYVVVSVFNKNICFTQILFSYFVTQLVVLSHFFLPSKRIHSENINEISIENFLEQIIFSRF